MLAIFFMLMVVVMSMPLVQLGGIAVAVFAGAIFGGELTGELALYCGSSFDASLYV